MVACLAADVRRSRLFGIAMILWVSASHARAAFRTGRGRPMLMAAAAIPVAIFLSLILLGMLSRSDR